MTGTTGKPARAATMKADALASMLRAEVEAEWQRYLDPLSGDETAGVGMDDATPVTTDYKERDNAFTGRIVKVTVDVKPMGAAVKAQADAAQREVVAKKAASD